jgi:CheY-like chemotaxis protein
MSPPSSNCPEILIVEDNPGDVRLMQEALRESDVPTLVRVVGDGEEAIQYLRRRGRYEQAARPDLIFLDLNLPKKGGLEVLAEVKSDRLLGRIPVVVLTTSQAYDDVATAYDLHANCYIAKPGDFDRFVSLVQSVQNFWLTAVTPPPR